MGNGYFVEHGQIEKQLQKVLSSVIFRNAQILSAFLKFIVEETLAERTNEIKEYTIATKVLGRPADFNSQFDAVVRIQAGRLRRFLSEYYRTEGFNDPILIEVPKGAYVPFFKKNTTEEVAGKTIAISNTADLKSNGHKNIVHRKVTLVVFPFQNLSSDNANDYFVESIGEQLSIDFAKFQQLSVISYYSISKDLVDKKDISYINEGYDVDYVLTGSIRFSERTVQINIQFVCAATGTLAWTQTFVQPYTVNNLYTIQDGIIEQVVNRVADIDGIITKNVINGPLSSKKDEFGIYYPVYQYFGSREKYDAENYRQIQLALEGAAITDPTNALVLSLLANLFLDNLIFKIEVDNSDLKKASNYAERALWLDPNCQYAYKALAWVHMMTGKKDDCLEAIERCLDMNSKAVSIVGNMGFLLMCIGKYSQGFRLLLRSIHLNPVMSWYVGLGFALYYYNSKDYKATLDWIERANIPDFALKSLVQIAAINKLKAQQNDRPGKEEFRISKHRAIEQPNKILQQYIYDNELRKDLAEGLIFAGLKMN